MFFLHNLHTIRLKHPFPSSIISKSPSQICFCPNFFIFRPHSHVLRNTCAPSHPRNKIRNFTFYSHYQLHLTTHLFVVVEFSYSFFFWVIILYVLLFQSRLSIYTACFSSSILSSWRVFLQSFNHSKNLTQIHTSSQKNEK